MVKSWEEGLTKPWMHEVKRLCRNWRHLAWTAGWMQDEGQNLAGREVGLPMPRAKDVVGRVVDDVLLFMA